MDFGVLKDDESFIKKVTDFNESLTKINESIGTACNFPNYESLSMEDKVKLDIYLSYSINSLFWMYLKTIGIEPNQHNIRSEILRVKQIMLREKQIRERKTIRPVLDKGAAGRFIRHGLWDPNQPKDSNKPQAKKRKFPE